MPPTDLTTRRPNHQITWPAFRDAARDTLEFIRTEHRVPSRIYLGPDSLAPADFLVGLANAWEFFNTNARPPEREGVMIGGRVRLLTERFVAEDTPGLFGGWIIHKEGFRAPKVMEQARLQAWTLKPAISASNAGR